MYPVPFFFQLNILSFPGVRRRPPHSSLHEVICPFLPSATGEYSVNHCPAYSFSLFCFCWDSGLRNSQAWSHQAWARSCRRPLCRENSLWVKSIQRKAGLKGLGVGTLEPLDPIQSTLGILTAGATACFGLVWFSLTLLCVTFLSSASVDVWPKTFKETSGLKGGCYADLGVGGGMGGLFWLWDADRGGWSWRSLLPIASMWNLGVLATGCQKTSRK